MLPRKAEPTEDTGRHDGPRDRCGAFRVVLSIGSLAIMAACTLGAPVPDSAAATDIRDHLTMDDRHIAEMAVQIAMERRNDNEASTWTNGVSGNHGAVVPRRTYRTGTGAFCRQYEEMVTVAGVAVSSQRTACRDDSGRWTTVT